MAKSFTFFVLALLLLSSVEARVIPTITWPESDPHKPLSSVHMTPSPEEEPSFNEDGCSGLESEEYCLIRRSMVEHTDYIYTQDISGP